MKCIYRPLLYSLSLTLLSGTQLFWEDFSNDEIPPDWAMEPNWRVGSEGYQDHVVVILHQVHIFIIALPLTPGMKEP